MIDIYELPISQLIPHPDNPRKDLGDLEELSESIRTNGIRQNLTVVAAERVDGVTIPEDGEPHYVVVIGHRRLAAAKLAGLSTVPCAVEIMDRKEQLSTMLLENMQRSDLTVYEQAWGFQQMSLLGCSVEEISTKSGFSKSTVRRRLKMAELDQATLKKVSGRQLSLADFDKLNELEDVKLRNRVLKDIGTKDFEASLQMAKIDQEVKKNLPTAKEWLKAHNAQEITNRNGYSVFCGDMGRYYGYIYIDKLGTNGNKFPTEKEVAGIELYYIIDGRNLSLYVKGTRSSSGSGPKTEEEKSRDRLLREVRAKVKELASLHFTLRQNFIEGLTVTKSNRDAVIAGALAPALFFAHCSGSNHSDTVDKILGLKRSYEYHTDKLIAGLDSIQEKDLAKAVYSIYNDREDNWFACDMSTPFTVPSYSESDGNLMLILLYRWLITLGYEMSTEEQALMDGSHEVYHRKVKKEKK